MTPKEIGKETGNRYWGVLAEWEPNLEPLGLLLL